jgi:hypothetical protein
VIRALPHHFGIKIFKKKREFFTADLSAEALAQAEAQGRKVGAEARDNLV